MIIQMARHAKKYHERLQLWNSSSYIYLTTEIYLEFVSSASYINLTTTKVEKHIYKTLTFQDQLYNELIRQKRSICHWCVDMQFENRMVDQVGLVIMRDMLNVSTNHA